MSYQILLFYKFIAIENAEAFTAQHLAFCQHIGVLGRIIIAPEGINGTLSGTIEQTDRYVQDLQKDPRFRNIDFKMDPAPAHAFKRLSVRFRPEIVTLGGENIDPNMLTGTYLAPEAFQKAMQDEDAIIIDARNDYEYEMGHFQNAIRPDVQSFKEFPNWVRAHLAPYRDKKILTYCTGGIRCEKFSGLLLREGFRKVFQLQGGIIRYGQDANTKGKGFEGRCFVFDDRLSVPVNRSEEVIITKCLYCGTSTDHFVNCAHLDCHKSFYVCASCDRLHKRSCSQACERAEHHEFAVLGEALFTYGATPRGLFKSVKVQPEA